MKKYILNGIKDDVPDEKKFENGAAYVGQLKNNLRNGKGII